MIGREITGIPSFPKATILLPHKIFSSIANIAKRCPENALERPEI